MLSTIVLKFLKNLKQNNNKPWMDLHRNEYEKAKADFHLFVDEMINNIAKFDASIGMLKSKECSFRINRDIRFSKDKRPYKNNMAAYFNREGKKGRGAGYYIHIEPGKSFVAAGIWMPEAKDLAAIRQEIDYNFEEWEKILNAASFKNQFKDGIDNSDTLVRPPKGYTDDNPAITYLKFKSFIFRKSFSDKEVLDSSFPKAVSKTFQTVKPVIEFINRSLD